MGIKGKMTQSIDSLFWQLLKSAFVLYLLIIGAVYFFQRKLQYFPNPHPVSLPQEQKFRGLKNITLVTKDKVIVFGWYWPGSIPVTIVFFHGNAGHRGHRLNWIQRFHEYGYGIFILDYRGYGGSKGTPTENGLYQDSQTALNWLKSHTDHPLVYLGESLGSSVAVEMATRTPPKAIIIQSGFPSAVEVAREHYPFLPVSLLMKDTYLTQHKISGVTCPILCIHGGLDTVVPVELGRSLYDSAPEPKQWLLIPKAKHNDVIQVGADTYFKSVGMFLERFVLKGADQCND